MSATPSTELRELARSYGVHFDYVDMSGQSKPASSESLLAVLRVLGAELSCESDAARALRARRLLTWRRRMEPVVIAWDDAPATVDLRLPEGLASSNLICRLTTELGDIHEWTVTADQASLIDRVEVEGERFVVLGTSLPDGLPSGYHRLVVAFDDWQVAEAKVIAAPRRVYQRPGTTGKRPWGIFCPLYSLHRSSSWGAGDFSDLEALIDWTAKLGGGLVATLPMLASNFDGPSPIVGPYSPTSRLFWNEFYLDLEQIPELAHCEGARMLLASEDASREVEALRSSSLIEYGRQMKLKRAVLEVLAACYFSRESSGVVPGGKQTLTEFLESYPEVKSYALFQALGEKHGRNWRDWPDTPIGQGQGSDRDLDDKAYRYHLYVQWQADKQLGELASKARQKGLSWYLDFPVGVDHNSYDLWKYREIFAAGASVGCPPDPVFTKGQDWGFPPLHPERQRESGYAYLIASFRNHLKYANALRIDHVMGLHRLFWIPEGAEAKDGAFVSTPADEIYAILSVESHRHQAWLVGEDLGTVPPEVDGAMKEHKVQGMYVIQYEVRPDSESPLRDVPESTVASINTHDMPPFAAFWSGLDLDDRKNLGLLDGERLQVERQVRDQQRQALIHFLRREGMLAPDASDTGAVLRATWDWLAASPAGVLLLNIEDLWLETEPQNTPNTYDERPNWRRKLRLAFEQFAENPEVLETLRDVNLLRESPPGDGIPGDESIPKDVLFEAIESALATAAKKHYPDAEEITVKIDQDSGKISMAIDGKAIVPPDFGRIAAQTAKQVIIRKIRETGRNG